MNFHKTATPMDQIKTLNLNSLPEALWHTLLVGPGVHQLTGWRACFVPCVNGIFCTHFLCLPPLHIVRFIHIIACCCGSLIFIAEQNFLVQMYNLFVHSIVVGHLNNFECGAIMSWAAMTILIHVFGWMHVSISVEHLHRSELWVKGLPNNFTTWFY